MAGKKLACIEAETLARSECHAWGSLALYELPSAVLGIKPASAGIQDGDNGNRAGRSDGTLLNLKERQGRLTFYFRENVRILNSLTERKMRVIMLK